MNKEYKKYLEEDYKRLLKSANENFKGRLETDFGKETFGSHELLDRSMLLHENWESYILSHPTNVLDRKLFDVAWKIKQAIYHYYQLVGAWDWKGGKNE